MSLSYHIATASGWAQAQADGEYTTSTRGKTLAEPGLDGQFSFAATGG